MKFGISNLSWERGTVGRNLGEFDYLETVFSRRGEGVYYSTQSIFHDSNISSLQDPNTLKYLEYVVDECLKLGIERIVLGSPSLRKGKKKNMTDILDFLDVKLQGSKTILCVEPNSKYYGGEYYFSLDEIVPDIKKYTNIKTMIDTHNLVLEGENVFEQYEKYSDYIKHIHLSEKDLNKINDWIFSKKIVKFLREKKYKYGITYELKMTVDLDLEIKKFLELKK